MARELAVHLVGDSRSLERAFARGSKSATAFSKTVTGQATRARSALSGIAGSFGIAFGAVGIVGGIKASIDAASDLNEQLARSEVTFGKSAAAIQTWSKSTANSFGIAQSDALEAASNFAALFDQIGKGDRVTAAMSKQFVELAGDLASFTNVPTKQALEDLRSGLSNEVEPLRKYGILIDAARVKSEAYRSGIAKIGDELTQGQKVQATYQLILRQTQKAQGDAARTADSFANQSRQLQANLKNTAAAIGATLLPKLNELVTRFNAWISVQKNQRRVAKFIGDAFSTIVGFFTGFGKVIAAVADAVGGWRTALVGVITIWAAFRAAGVAAAGAVAIANSAAAGLATRVWIAQATATTVAASGAARAQQAAAASAAAAHIAAARVASTAWRAGLAATGVGLFVVAIGVGAEIVIRKWTEVKAFFAEFFLWLQSTGLRAFRQFIEPFSKIPTRAPGPLGDLGKWARGMEDELNRQLPMILEEAGRKAGDKGGKKSGESFVDQFTRELQKALKDLKIPKLPKLDPIDLTPGGGTPKMTANDRRLRANQWFDANIARQLDRLQDLGLRKQLVRLKQIAAEVRAQLALTHDKTRQLNLQDQLVSIARQQRSVQEQITAKIREGNELLKERAEAIKSAVLERLQRKQTDILNKRALADAQDALRIAKQLGGPKGIQEAQRGVADVQLEMLKAKVERAPATLKGGQFALGGVITINVNGVTDPAEVARRVEAVLTKRKKHTATQSRGPAAANA